MSVFQHADEKPIPARGWLWLLVYAMGVAILLRWCCAVPSAHAEVAERDFAIAPGRTHRSYCPFDKDQHATPQYAQKGACAEVRCTVIGGQVVLLERIRCQEESASVRMAGFGFDEFAGPYFVTECKAGTAK